MEHHADPVHGADARAQPVTAGARLCMREADCGSSRLSWLRLCVDRGDAAPALRRALCAAINWLERRLHRMSVPARASEELLAAPLPQFIQNLGLAVAEANGALRREAGDIRYTIPEAEIEIRVAISVTSEREAGAELKLGFQAFALSGSYSSTFGFREEASSTIRLKVQAVPLAAPAP